MQSIAIYQVQNRTHKGPADCEAMFPFKISLFSTTASAIGDTEGASRPIDAYLEVRYKTLTKKMAGNKKVK